jgi:acetyl esterase
MSDGGASNPGAEDVDPAIRAFVRRVNAAYAEHLGEGPVDVARARAVAETVREPWRTGGPAMAHTEERRVGREAIRVRIHRPLAGATLPALVYLHGGGWTSFSLDTHDRLMREYAHRAGCAVVGVDYSLSPEVRFPRALVEVGQVLAWLREEGASAGIDPARLAIGGDSAGANLALASTVAARDLSQPLVRGLLLAYGAFDETPRESHARYGGEGYILTAAEMDWFWRNYRGEDRSTDPLARPLHADLSGLPPVFLCIAECDILADENREMARRLAEAGVEVTAEIYRGATHSFLEAVSISGLAERAIDDGARFLRRILAP